MTPGTTNRFMVTTAPPSSVTAGTGFGLVISDGQSASDVDSTFTGSVTATIYNSADVNEGTETETAVKGVATFSGLTLDQAGSGYTITVTSSASGAPTSITTGPFDVVAAAPTQLIVTSSPSGTVTAGSTFDLTVELADQFNNVATNYSGTVNVNLASNPGGGPLGGDKSATVSPTNTDPGYATFTDLSLIEAADGYKLGLTSSGGLTTTSGDFNVAASAATQLVVISQPPGTVNASAPFGLTVAVEDNYGNVIPNYDESATVKLMNNPASSTLGGTTTASVGSTGDATFTGLSINNPGDGYTLIVSATGLASATTTGINVLSAGSPTPTPTPTSTPPSIIAASPVTTQKVNPKTHKKVGKPVLAGYTITFSTAMNAGTLANTANYVVDTVVPVKKTKKKPATIKRTPVGFAVTGETSDTVTLKPAGTPFKSKAGQIEVTVGVESAAGAFLTSTETLTISKGGKSISLG